MIAFFKAAWAMAVGLPKEVKIAIGVCLLVALGLFFHARAVSNYGEKKFTEGVAHEQKRITKRLEKIAADSERVARDAQELAKKDFRRISNNADTQRLRGAGKAACAAVTPPTASQPVRSDPAGSTPVAPVSVREGQQLFGLPVAGTIALAENHDLCWARERAWNQWYGDLTKIWNQQN